MVLTFTIVSVGWIFSLCLHEFSHAFVAYLGGDYTVREKGYLTNPLKYIHPVTSILLPLLVLAMGGIGLPGGAVRIESGRLRSIQWMSAVSLAGPASNLLLAVILGIILHFAPLTTDGIWPGLAFLAQLQVTAFLFNLIPISPFDGYGAIRPYLPQEIRQNMDFLGQFSLWLILIIFLRVPLLNEKFWVLVAFACNLLSIPSNLAALGFSQFQFWR